MCAHIWACIFVILKTLLRPKDLTVAYFFIKGTAEKGCGVIENMRIFFAVDVHGGERVFRKFLGAANYYQADVMILSGDLTGKVLIPIIKQSDGTFTATIGGNKRLAKTKRELKNLEEMIRFSGSYFFYTTPEKWDKLKNSKNKLNEEFDYQVVKIIEEWVSLAEKHLRNKGIKCFFTPGNDDIFAIDKVLEDSDFVINPDGKVVYIDKLHEMISLGYSDMTPWNCPRDIPESELAKKIELLTLRVKDMKNCVFNFHTPPYGSGLDNAPALDEELRPIPGIIEPVGSTSVYEAVRKYQPLLGLFGHIHESKGDRKIGRTLCINPGSEYGEGILHGALINLNEKGVKSYLLVQG